MPTISRESLYGAWVTIADALRPVLGWLGHLLFISFSLLPSALMATHFLESISSGTIGHCVFVPAASPKSLRSIVCGGTALLFIPGARSSFLKFALFAYSLYTVATTAKNPCIAYAVMLPAIKIRLMQLREILQPSVMLWPGIWLWRYLDSSPSIFSTVSDSWARLVWFSVICLVCLIPRLNVGMRAQAAHGGVMISFRGRAIAVAVFYQFSEAVLSNCRCWWRIFFLFWPVS